jgi:SAM-dependent methyltransferase
VRSPESQPRVERPASASQQFGRAAAAYATAGLFAAGEDLARIVEAARPAPSDRALDIACGAGHVALALSPHVESVVGVDITAPLLTEARRLALERGVATLDLVAASAHAIPLKDGAFDIVTCRYAAHHFPDISGALREMSRLLADGGRLLIVDVVGPHDANLDAWLQRIEILRDPSHVHDHSLADWMALFEREGFSVTSLRTWKLPLDVDAWLRRMNTPAVPASEIVRILEDANDAARRYFNIETDGALRIKFDVALFVAEPR